MKRIFSLCLLAGLTLHLSAQDLPNDSIQDGPTLFCHLAKVPVFPGGSTAMAQYIANSINYPEDALQEGIEGKVVTTFLIDKTGTVGQVSIKTPLYPSLDAEALRIIRSLPEFQPGIDLEDEPTEVWFTTTVIFKKPEEKPAAPYEKK